MTKERTVSNWWQTFFDDDYLHVWGGFIAPERTRQEAESLWQLLELGEGSRVLDAPCGYGRLAREMARSGAVVLGVDQSEHLLAQAEKNRGDVAPDRLWYVRHDLRQPLAESGFDAAFNVYSSLGYGTEQEDLAILRTIAAAVRPGGLVFVDTMHRDAAAARLSRGDRPASRLADGTLVIEEPAFDAIPGRVVTSWYWSGPRGSGKKSASLRVYSATELVALMARAGLRFRSAHNGCSPEPFRGEGPDMGGRLGILAEVSGAGSQPAAGS
jgi:SAM-dependent methyltransferase